MRINGKVASALAGAAATLIVVACTAASTGPVQPSRGSCDQNCNLQNMSNQYPDYFQIFMNVQGQPTLAMVCIGGAGIMTTSRDQSAAAAQVVPQWADFCKTQIGSRFSVTGNINDEPRYAKVP